MNFRIRVSTDLFLQRSPRDIGTLVELPRAGFVSSAEGIRAIFELILIDLVLIEYPMTCIASSPSLLVVQKSPSRSGALHSESSHMESCAVFKACATGMRSPKWASVETTHKFPAAFVITHPVTGQHSSCPGVEESSHQTNQALLPHLLSKSGLTSTEQSPSA